MIRLSFSIWRNADRYDVWLSVTKFTKRQAVFCSIEELKVRNHKYSNVGFVDFCNRIFKADLGKKEPPEFALPQKLLKNLFHNNTNITGKIFSKK
jgi:hypothetical protein